MRFIVLAALLCVAAAKLQVPASGSWAYDAQGKWPGVCTTGKQQSPIDIRPEDVDRVNMTELRFHHYDTAGAFNVTGNGKSVRVYGFDTWKQRPYINGGGLDGNYTLDEVHFHWYRKGEQPGSEHSINGTHYPIEIHMVHRGQIEGQEHVAVIAVFVQLDETSDVSDNSLHDLLVMMQGMDHLKSPPGEDRTVTSWYNGLERKFSPAELLPADRAGFYRYEGSLTTPNCDEVVTWTVMETPLLSMNRHDADYITDLYTYNSTEFVNNQRSQQDLNGRRVILRDPTATKTTPSSAAHDRCAFWPLATAIAALLTVSVKLPDGIFF